MINKLKLNKKPVVNLPDEDVLIGEYARSKKCGDKIPDFEPNIIINNWGAIRLHNKKFTHASQLWIKTDNEELKEFILNYDWRGNLKAVGAKESASKRLTINKFKEVLLKEYYAKQIKTK